MQDDVSTDEPEIEPTYRELVILDVLRNLSPRDHWVMTTVVEVLAASDTDPAHKKLVSELLRFSARQVDVLTKDVRRLTRRLQIAEGRLQQHEPPDPAASIVYE